MARPGNEKKAKRWGRFDRTSRLRSSLSDADASRIFETLSSIRQACRGDESAFLLEWAMACRDEPRLSWFFPARKPIGDIPPSHPVDGFPQRIPLLCEAASKGCSAALSTALDLGADPDLAWNVGLARGDAVLSAAAHGKSLCLEILLSRGADPDGLLEDGTSVLMKACSSPFLGAGESFGETLFDTVSTLLRFGADPALRDSSKRGALHHCAMARKPQSQSLALVVDALLQSGCPTAPDSSGLSPESLAVRHSNPEFLMAILSLRNHDRAFLESLDIESQNVLAKLAR